MKQFMVYCLLAVCFAIGFVVADDLEPEKRNQLFQASPPVKNMLIRISRATRDGYTHYIRAELLFDLEDVYSSISGPKEVDLIHTAQQGKPIYLLEHRLYIVNMQKETWSSSYKTVFLDDKPAIVLFKDPDGSKISALNQLFHSPEPIQKMLILSHGGLREGNTQSIRAELLFDLKNNSTPLNGPQEVIINHTSPQGEHFFRINRLYSVNMQKQKNSSSYKTVFLDNEPPLVEFIDPDGSKVNALINNANSQDAPRDEPIIQHNQTSSAASSFPPFKLHNRPLKRHRVPILVS